MGLHQLEPMKLEHMLRKFVFESGLSYRQVSKKTGIGRATLHAWIYGKNSPQIDTFCGCLSKLGYELVIRDKATNKIRMWF